MIRRQTDVLFAMAAFDIADRELELMPWHDPEVSQRKGVGEGAGKTLQYVSDELQPVLRERYEQLVVLGGYSLGGLFSLWAASLTGEFAAVNACSPSLCILDWIAFAGEHPLKAPVAYMTLGNREERSKNKAISREGDCVMTEHLLHTGAVGQRPLHTGMERRQPLRAWCGAYGTWLCMAP